MWAQWYISRSICSKFTLISRNPQFYYCVHTSLLHVIILSKFYLHLHILYLWSILILLFHQKICFRNRLCPLGYSYHNLLATCVSPKYSICPPISYSSVWSSKEYVSSEMCEGTNRETLHNAVTRILCTYDSLYIHDNHSNLCVFHIRALRHILFNQKPKNAHL